MSSFYSMEELLPVVAKLTGKYTCGESSSIPYEKARQLMGAVKYCIDELFSSGIENELSGSERIDAFHAYKAGYQQIMKKAGATQQRYNDMICHFKAYGNENYRDTVTKAIPGFFLYYDARFAPQETIITLDYPILWNMGDLTGIDAVEKYVDGLTLEQRFLERFSDDYVKEILSCYAKDYEKQFFNLSSVVFRHILACMLIGKRTWERGTEKEYDRLRERIFSCTKEKLKKSLFDLLWGVIQNKYEQDERLYDYLSQDIEDFTVWLMHGARQNQLRRVVVL